MEDELAEVKLTAEEEAVISGDDVDGMERPLSLHESLEVKRQEEEDAPAETLEVAEVDADEPVAEDAEREEDTNERANYAERANKGLLKEIKRLRDSNRGYKQQWNELQGRLAGIEEKLEPKQEEVDPEPNREEEPLDWLLWQQNKNTTEKLDEALAPQKEEAEARKAYETEAKKDEIIHQIASNSETEAFADASDSEREEYQVKMSHMRDMQFSQMVKNGMNQQQAYQAVLRNERDFIEEALEEGSNPALKALEIYDNQGFKLTDYEPWMEYKKESGNDSPGEEESPKKEPATNPKIEAVRKGQKVTSLGTHAGGAQRMTITYDQFSEMDIDDPIAAQIYASEKKLSEISVTGKTTIQ